jgi:hypothetical protein
MYFLRIAIAVNTTHVSTAVLNTDIFELNAKYNTAKFRGKFMTVPIAVSVIASIHAFLLSKNFIHLIDQISLSVLDLMACLSAN